MAGGFSCIVRLSVGRIGCKRYQRLVASTLELPSWRREVWSISVVDDSMVELGRLDIVSFSFLGLVSLPLSPGHCSIGIISNLMFLGQ